MIKTVREMFDELIMAVPFTNKETRYIPKIKAALEKQIPKKPMPHKVDVEKIKIGNANWCKGTTIYYCPNCKDFISRIYTYCHKCGQALLWGDCE